MNEENRTMNANDPEPALQPRKTWEAWFKRQSCNNQGWIAHAEWRRKAKAQKNNE